MEQSIFFDGKEYISSKRASQISKYTKDYVGQLCRGNKIDARLVGRNWYVNLESLRGHMDDASSRPKELSQNFLKDELKEGQKINKPSKPSLFVSHFKKKHIEHSRKDPQRAWHMIDRNREKENLLTHMEVVYDESHPVFFEDDAPLYPQPSKSDQGASESQIYETGKERSKASEDSDKTIFYKADLVAAPIVTKSVPSPIKIKRHPYDLQAKRKAVVDSVVPMRRGERSGQEVLVKRRAAHSQLVRRKKQPVSVYGLALVLVGLALLAGSLFVVFQDTGSINYTAQVEPALQ